MALYAIGDVQGCADALHRLLDRIQFDPARDTVWFTGDLVNRGPRSDDVLRCVRGLGDRAVSVLGNHDLSLLAVAAGHVRPGRKDTHNAVLDAADRDELLAWLRQLPMLHHAHGYTLVHAGLPPAWDLDTARRLASEVEQELRGPDHDRFLARLYGSKPRQWSEDLVGPDRLRFAVNAMTRMRYCEANGKLDFDNKGAPGTQAKGLVPWFDMPNRRNRDLRIVFGHWAALGLCLRSGIYGIDTGCVWGNRLTAIRLDDREPYVMNSVAATE